MSNGLTMIGGRDEKGLFLAFGPTTREVIAIMLFREIEKGTWAWHPYKFMRGSSPKHLRHAKRILRNLRLTYREQRFRLENIWESVPIDEMEKTYYDTEIEIFGELRERLGRPGRFGLRLGRFGRFGLSWERVDNIDGLSISDTGPAGTLEKILTFVGETGVEVNPFDPSESAGSRSGKDGDDSGTT